MSEKSLSKEQHEQMSSVFIVKLREKIEESLSSGVLEEDARCGRYARLLDELIWCFFDDGRDECGLDHPSSLMTVSELLDFFEKSLEKISNYRPDLLTLDWQGKWQIIEEPEEY